MDKSWIEMENRTQMSYIAGANGFLDFALANQPCDSVIYCPCRKCGNMTFVTRQVAFEHIIIHGFLPNYKNWVKHGEPLCSVSRANGDGESMNDCDIGDDMVGMLHDAFGIPNNDSQPSGEEQRENIEGPDVETKAFFKRLEDAERELYPGCRKFTSLSFMVRMMVLKVMCSWSDRSFTLALQLFKEALPKGETLPNSFYEAKKIIDDLGFTYEKWDACPNDCIIYRNEYKDLKECKDCHVSRYKQFDGQSNNVEDETRKIAAKQVRYFPLKPRLKRLFMSSKTASLMRWHSEGRTKDGVLRHPADSRAWKAFDERHVDFSSDCRNVRLGLSADGFNPFKTMSITHSTWPVLIMPYNLPPWLCMKQPFIFLSTLIDGPRAPGNKIDVYLQPLVEELKELWDHGVLTYDASTNKMFQMHASLMWTISDFPAYANLSGWSTKGRYACPCCNKDTRSEWLTNGGKYCYMGHRRFLDHNHRFRKDRVSFDGMREKGLRPTRLSGTDLLQQLDEVEAHQIAVEKKRKRGEDVNEDTNDWKKHWKKRSIFFQLPYWEHNEIRHNLDVMHIEKNVCDNILYTLLGVKGKTKDNLKARRDLENMGIRKALHPKQRGANSAYMPPACFTMNKEHKKLFCRVLKNVKVPDGYASNIARRVNLKDCNILGLKSHDNHIIMQQLLPLAVRRSLPKNVSQAIIELCNFFRQLCSKVMTASDIEALQDRIAIILCHLERIFPPAFFDIMEHLPIHLADEAMIAGPVQYRWMYCIERFLLTLKIYVRNRAHPEGSIAEGYLVEECMNFCARYLNDAETMINRPIRNFAGSDNSSKPAGRPLGKGKRLLLDNITWAQAHRYVLVNSDMITPFREQHLAFLRGNMPRVGEHHISRVHNETFHTWLADHVAQMKRTSNAHISPELDILASGPDHWGWSYSGYIINGYRFRTKKREKKRNTQNSGVKLTANTMSYASSRDRNPRSGDVTFYGALTDIIEIRYTNDVKFVLFKCDWVDSNVGRKQDEFNFTMVNFNHLLYKENQLGDEPFILASQAEQVWYVQDPVETDWHIVVMMTQRNLFDMGTKESMVVDMTHPEVEPYSDQNLDDTTFDRDEDVPWIRQGVDGRVVEDNSDADINEMDE